MLLGIIHYNYSFPPHMGRNYQEREEKRLVLSINTTCNACRSELMQDTLTCICHEATIVVKTTFLTREEH